MKGLKDKRVLITGGASGIGAATAARFLEEGSQVCILDRDAAACESLRHQLPAISEAIKVVQPIRDKALRLGVDTGVKECDDLMAAYEKLFKCDKMPAAAKDAQKQGFEAMKSGWAQLKDAPQASKDAAATGCKASMDGIAQSAKAMGCE